MELPRPLVTVTTLSKVLAGVLFVLLPLLGFYLGMKYQTSISSKVTETSIVTAAPIKNNQLSELSNDNIRLNQEIQKLLPDQELQKENVKNEMVI